MGHLDADCAALSLVDEYLDNIPVLFDVCSEASLYASSQEAGANCADSLFGTISEIHAVVVSDHQLVRCWSGHACL